MTAEVVLTWGDGLLHIAHVPPGGSFTLGEDPDVDFHLGRDVWGERRLTIVDEGGVHVPAGAVYGGALVETALVQPMGPVSFTLGSLGVAVRMVDQEPKAPRSRIADAPPVYLTLAFLFAGVLVLLGSWVPGELSAQDADVRKLFIQIVPIPADHNTVGPTWFVEPLSLTPPLWESQWSALGRFGKIERRGCPPYHCCGYPARRAPAEVGRVDVTTARITVRGHLSRTAVRRVTRRHRSEVRLCYQQVLRAWPELEGRMTVRFVVMPQGTVGSARVIRSTLRHVPMELCVSNAVRRWSYPAPDNGGVAVVDHTFAFALP